MADELIDIYDIHGQSLGTALKSVAHREKLWHTVFFCWIVCGQNVLFQLRSSQKEAYPNKLDISVAGHLQAGECVADGVREVQEELGLSIQMSDLIELGVERWEQTAEICYAYLLKLDKDITACVLQVEEVSGLFAIDIDMAISLFSGQLESVQARGIVVDKSGKNKSCLKWITLQDFAHTPKYYLNVLKKIKEQMS